MYRMKHLNNISYFTLIYLLVPVLMGLNLYFSYSNELDMNNLTITICCIIFIYFIADRQYYKHMFNVLEISIQCMTDSYGSYLFQNESKYEMFKNELNQMNNIKLENTPEYSKFQELLKTFKTEINELEILETAKNEVHIKCTTLTTRMFLISDEMDELIEISNNNKINNNEKKDKSNDKKEGA